MDLEEEEEEVPINKRSGRKGSSSKIKSEQ